MGLRETSCPDSAKAEARLSGGETMNLFSRLSEILAFGRNEPWEKEKNLDSVFAWNEREMERDLRGVKRYAAAVVAVERSLARELKQHRTQAALCDGKAHEFLAAGQEGLARQAL